ncbi:MAG: HAD-IA family hydrolase [Alphaproteobacteria bacterium]|nr:HAD-IA family hydrolase [Alphaproteobacteria bacterium]
MLDPARYDAITFDCYGTLVDWDTGVANAFGPWAVKSRFAGTVADLIERFARHQREKQTVRPALNYRDVIGQAFENAACDLGGFVSEEDQAVFGWSVGAWPCFPDTIDALRNLKTMGFHLGVVSNVDNASFEDTHERMGGMIDTVVTAEMVGAYKPDLKMFEALFSALAARGIARKRILHVAQSRFHDVAPSNELGLDVVWIDRRHGRPGKGVTIPSEAEPLIKFDSLEAMCDSLGRKAILETGSGE